MNHCNNTKLTQQKTINQLVCLLNLSIYLDFSFGRTLFFLSNALEIQPKITQFVASLHFHNNQHLAGLEQIDIHLICP